MDNSLLTGVVMLETMWKTRHQDLIDLISPFIFYAVATICSPQDTIDQRKTREIVRSKFGFKDITASVIERALKRKPQLFRKVGKTYILSTPLDDYVNEIERRKNDCDEKLRILGEQIAKYLSSHVKKPRQYSSEEAVEKLQGFFARQGINLGTNQLEEHASELKGYETDYYIAQL